MEKLKCMKEMMVDFVEKEFEHLEEVDAKELGEAIDIIKDLAETMYYCAITEAMEVKDEHARKVYHDGGAPLEYGAWDSMRVKDRIKEIEKDMVETLNKATPEEKQMIKQKLNAWMNTIHE